MGGVKDETEEQLLYCILYYNLHCAGRTCICCPRKCCNTSERACSDTVVVEHHLALGGVLVHTLRNFDSRNITLILPRHVDLCRDIPGGGGGGSANIGRYGVGGPGEQEHERRLKGAHIHSLNSTANPPPLSLPSLSLSLSLSLSASRVDYRATHHPFTTAIGRSLTAVFEIPASAHVRTTSLTSLYDSGASSITSFGDATRMLMPRSCKPPRTVS